MTLSDVARKHNILPAHLAQAMGCSRQWVDEIGKKRDPTLRTIKRACAGFKEFGIEYTPQELFGELLREKEGA